jgi:hypothetical protein
MWRRRPGRRAGNRARPAPQGRLGSLQPDEDLRLAGMGVRAPDRVAAQRDPHRTGDGRQPVCAAPPLWELDADDSHLVRPGHLQLIPQTRHGRLSVQRLAQARTPYVTDAVPVKQRSVRCRHADLRRAPVGPAVGGPPNSSRVAIRAGLTSGDRESRRFCSTRPNTICKLHRALGGLGPGPPYHALDAATPGSS